MTEYELYALPEGAIIFIEYKNFRESWIKQEDGRWAWLKDGVVQLHPRFNSIEFTTSFRKGWEYHHVYTVTPIKFSFLWALLVGILLGGVFC